MTTSLRERNKVERTERILAAARELLREGAGQNLTVERIAERARVAPMTVFNLVGTREQIWAALADRVLEDLDISTLPVEDPHERARAMVDAVMAAVCGDAPVFRALLAGWSQSGRVLQRDPTDELVACLRSAADSGAIAPDLDVRRIGELISAGLIGVVHQWAAGLISDRALRNRSRDIVDLAFAAARPPGDGRPRWHLELAKRRQPAR
jgi:AcrR family transcriptional regulator